MMKNRTVLIAALVALAQIGFLGWIIMARAAVLRDGREIVLKVEPVDPRDLLRGDYVRLGYDIAQVPLALIENPDAVEARREDVAIFVRLARDAGGTWRVSRAALKRPAGAPLSENEIDIRGTVTFRPHASGDAVFRPDYGIERFYLPEGTGRPIEHDMRERPFFVKLAVASDGTAQIKQFLDGDTVLFSEPLY